MDSDLIFTILIPLFGTFLFVALIFYIIHKERKKNRYSPLNEKILRSPGYSLGKQIDETSYDFFSHMVLIIIIPLISFYSIRDFTSPIGKSILIFCTIVSLIWLTRKLKKQFLKVRNLNLGCDGEVYAGQELNYLMREGAWVYHDIPYKYGNIDHVVLSKGGIFTVETKTIRKPGNADGKKDVNVKIKGEQIIFPHFQTSKPVKQAKLHTKYLKEKLHKKTGIEFPIFTVIALPGWFIDHKLNDKKHGFLVINPKRGNAIKGFLQKERIPEESLEKAVQVIEDYARSVSTKTDLSDPNAKNKYDVFFNRKAEKNEL